MFNQSNEKSIRLIRRKTAKPNKPNDLNTRKLVWNDDFFFPDDFFLHAKTFVDKIRVDTQYDLFDCLKFDSMIN